MALKAFLEELSNEHHILVVSFKFYIIISPCRVSASHGKPGNWSNIMENLKNSWNLIYQNTKSWKIHGKSIFVKSNLTSTILR